MKKIPNFPKKTFLNNFIGEIENCLDITASWDLDNNCPYPPNQRLNELNYDNAIKCFNEIKNDMLRDGREAIKYLRKAENEIYVKLVISRIVNVSSLLGDNAVGMKFLFDKNALTENIWLDIKEKLFDNKEIIECEILTDLPSDIIQDAVTFSKELKKIDHESEFDPEDPVRFKYYEQDLEEAKKRLGSEYKHAFDCLVNYNDYYYPFRNALFF